MSAQPLGVPAMSTGTSTPAPQQRPSLRVLPIPVTEPAPLSAEEFAEVMRPPGLNNGPYRQDTLAVTFSREGPEALFARQPTSSTLLPEPKLWATQVLRVMLEVMDGSRPARQITRWVEHSISDRVARAGIVARRRGGRLARPAMVRSVHISTPIDGACEVAALVMHHGRYRAVAFRMIGVDGRWLVTALEIG